MSRQVGTDWASGRCTRAYATCTYTQTLCTETLTSYTHYALHLHSVQECAICKLLCWSLHHNSGIEGCTGQHIGCILLTNVHSLDTGALTLLR